jgi:hypothetical protein
VSKPWSSFHSLVVMNRSARKEMNLSIPAVLTRLFRARNRLREIYGLTPGLDCEPEQGKSVEGTP